MKLTLPCLLKLTSAIHALASVGHSNLGWAGSHQYGVNACVVDNIEVASIAVDWRYIRSEVNMTIVCSESGRFWTSNLIDCMDAR
jgi:hypothetical protein